MSATPESESERESAPPSRILPVEPDESCFDDRSFLSSPVDAQDRIQFPQNKLFGRSKELQTLQQIYDGMISHSSFTETKEAETRDQKGPGPSTVFLSGYSGCGKSAVVNSFVRQLEENQQPHLCLSVKYEAAQKIAPFSAFGGMFDNLHESKVEFFTKVHRGLENALGDDAAILMHLFPGLQKILKGDDDAVSTTSTLTRSHRSVNSYLQTQQIDTTRLNFVFQALFRALCTPEQPLVLFIDDLQWADYHSIDLLETLLISDTTRHMMFIGSYRSNEVDQDHPLCKAIDAMKAKQQLHILELHDLPKADVTTFLASALRLEPAEVNPLSHAVFSKTLGNPFFVIQAIEQLVRTNVLYYDTVQLRWAWTVPAQAVADLLSSNVVDLVQSKLRDMSAEMQKILILASFSRSSFDVAMIFGLIQAERAVNAAYAFTHDGPPPDRRGILGPTLLNIDRNTVISTLERAVVEGILLNGSNEGEFSFVHDRVQEAAASLVSGMERDDIYALVGNALVEREAREEGEDWMLFVAAHHLNALPLTYHDQASKLRLAELNQKAAHISIGILAFASAMEYADSGIRNLPGDAWKTHTHLSIRLYSMGAEAAKGSADVDRAERYFEEVLAQKVGSVQEKLSAYKVKLDILAGKNRKAEALKISLEVLRKLGCSIPRLVSMQRIRAWQSLQKTKEAYIPNEEFIVSMPFAMEPEILDLMDLIEKTGSFAYSLNMVPLYVLTRCKLVRWMMKHGLTEYSGAAIASFSNILMHVYGDFETGQRLAELALLIQDRLKSKYTSTRTLNTANMNVLGWVRPLKSRLRYHLQAYEAGMVSGNIEGAVIGRMYSYWVHLYSSLPLKALEEDCREHIPKMRQMGYHFYADLSSLIWQSALNLMGQSNTTHIMTGSTMDEDEYAKKPFKHSMAVRKSFLLVFFEEWGLGAQDALERGDSYTKAFIGAGYGFEPFYRAICLYAMGRRTGQTKYRAPADKIRSEIRSLVKHGCLNLVHLISLLDAEHFALMGNMSKARDLYEEAITLAVNDGFSSNAGLTCERYADLLIYLDETTLAVTQLSRASENYRRWGANRKVEHLQKKIQQIQEGTR